MRGGRGLLILGNLVVEAQVRLSRALIPSVEGARPQGESRLAQPAWHRQGSSQDKNKSSKSLRGVATRTAEISGVLARTTGATRPEKRAEVRNPRPPHRSPRSCCAAVRSLSPLLQSAPLTVDT